MTTTIPRRLCGVLGLGALLAAWVQVFAPVADAQVFGGARMMRVVGPQPAGGAAVPIGGKAGLHIPPGKTVSFTYTLSDGAGFQWDIQYYGTIGQGTNYAYAGGLYLQINGANIHSNGRGWANADGDEVEIGPYSTNNVRIYRRIRVYKDQGLARWLDIYENPAAQDATVNVRVYSNTNWVIGNQVYSSGKSSFTDEDLAFVTQSQGGNAPAVLHYVCGKRTKVRPTVSIQQNQIYVNYNLTVPAGKTVVVCYFESQSNSVSDLTKVMKTFRPQTVMKDLPASVRKMIVNMQVSSGLGEVELERAGSADVVYNRNGDPIFGTITNQGFPVETLFGQMTIPADQVVGLASMGEEDGRFRVVLTGGQVLAGRMPAGSKVAMSIPSGGTLQVPFDDIRQCSYRLSASRPEDGEFAGPLMILRTGDRVAFQPDSLAMKLRTRHGTVDLSAKDLLSISLDNPGNAVHRATFLNGSRLAGFLEPEQVPLTLKLGPKLTVARNMVARVQFAAEEKTDGTLDAVSLSNGDELFGRLAAEKLTFKTDYGPMTFRPENIQAMSFSPTHTGRATIQLWDGTVLRGQCEADTLPFQIVPGPTVDIYIGQYVQIRRNQALPPKETRERVEKLIAQLGAESYKDRQAATEELIKMGKGIAPLLQKHLTSGDPEVRQRIQDIIEKLGGGAGPSLPGAGNPGPVFGGGQIQFERG